MSVAASSNTDEVGHRLQKEEINHSAKGQALPPHLHVKAEQRGCPGDALQDATPVRHKVS